MTYHQLMKWREDDHGAVEARVVIADSYDGLFVGLSESVEITGLSFNDFGKSAPKDIGGIEATSISFTLDESSIDITSIGAKNLLLSASINSVYLAVFISTSNLPSSADALFKGVVDKRIEAQDLLWHGSYYDDNPNPIRLFKMSATPYELATINQIKLTDLIYGNVEEIITGIDTAWEEANVKPRQGYYYLESKKRRTVHPDLVNLNDLIRKLTDNLKTTLVDKSLGNFDIKYDVSEIPNSWHPARFALLADPDNPSIKTYMVREPISSSTRSGTSVLAYDVFLDDKMTLFINPDNKPLIEETTIGLPSNPDTIDYYTKSMWINYRTVKPLENEPNPKLAQPFRIDKYENLFEFLDDLAKLFGMYIKLYWGENNDLRIKFVGREDINQTKLLLIKSASKADLKPTSKNVESSKERFNSRSWYNALEGPDLYKRDYEGVIIKSDRMEGLTFNDLTFTISPTVCLSPKGSIFKIAKVYMPHNVKVEGVDGGIVSNTEDKLTKSLGLHNALYLCADSGISHPDFVYSTSYYWVPAGAISTKVDGIDKTFYSMSDYVNFLKSHDQEYNLYEYNLDIPFFYFTKNQENQIDWRDVSLFNRIALDGVEWIIVDIKWNFKELKYSLALQSKEKFNFVKDTDSLDEKRGIIGDFLTDIQEQSSSVNISGNLEAGVQNFDLVSITENGTYERTLPATDHYHRIDGIAILDDNGELIRIQKSGTIFSTNFADEPLNTQIHLRATESGNNWTTSRLLVPNANEEMLLTIGKYVGYKTIEINSGFQPRFILK